MVMASTTLFQVGTSGFSYDEWRPAFYPEGLKKAAMLSFYAGQLPSVELNNTFYRLPTVNSVQSWSDQVPASFRFAIKATRGLTWSNRMVDCGERLDNLFQALSPLGDKLGCVFYQVPKFVLCDVAVLQRFLADQPRGIKIAFDFMHDSWRDPAVLDMLHRHGATAVVTDKDDESPPDIVCGAPWHYLRLRRAAYSDGELRLWRDRVLATGVRDAFVFFKHEDSATGPALARRFLDL
jgi:uncharacterized protein YecE (DUF72 family)